MSVEFEELKLTVTLVDNTSQALAQLRVQLLAVNQQAGATSARLQQISGHANVWGSQVRGLSLEIEKLYINIPFLGTQLRGLAPKIEGLVASLPLWARFTGLAGAAVAALGVGLVKLGQSLGEFARTNVAIGAMARSLGITSGEFKVLQRQLTSVMSKEDAQHTVVALGQVTQAMMDGSSQLRREWIQGAGREFQDQATMIADGIARLGKSGNLAQVANFIRASLDESYRRTAAGPGGTAEAARDQAEMLRRLNLPASFMLAPRLRDATAEEVKHEEEMLELSKKMATEWGKVVAGAQNVIETIEGHLLGPMHDLTLAILSLGDQWDKTVGGTIESTLQELRAILKAVEFVFNMKDKIRGAITGEHPAGGAGGPVVPPLTGPLFLPMGPGGVGGPLWPFGLGGELKQEQKNEIAKDNTKELSDLNDSLGQLLNKLGPRNIPKLARGGIIGQPTLALIGEAGPEAVVPLRAMQEGGVVDKPTLALLGEGGPEAVVPLARGVRRGEAGLPGRSNVSGGGIRRVPHSAAEIAGWQQYFTNPITDIAKEMEAAESTAKQSVLDIGKQTTVGGTLLQTGKAGLDVLNYANPAGALASAITHTTLGRLAGGAVGGREAGNVVADVVQPFVTAPAFIGGGPVSSGVEAAAKTASYLNLARFSKTAQTGINLAGRAGQSIFNVTQDIGSNIEAGARSLIDRKQGAALQANLTGTSDISVEVPPDTLAKPGGEGLFKQHKAVRQTQMEKASEGPHTVYPIGFDESRLTPAGSVIGRGQIIR